MTSFKNTYQPVKVEYPHLAHLETAQEDYDYNFVFDVKTLRSDRVELRPFLPKRDAQATLEGLGDDSLLEYIGCGTFTDINDICEYAEEYRRNPTTQRYSIYSAPLDRLDAPREEYTLAGIVSLVESSYEQMLSEIGWLVVFQPFQRTHVMTHAVGLLMHYLLDSVEQGGLGLRRCQWKAHSLNTKSQVAAIRMGFEYEGLIKAFVVMPKGKEGVADGRPGRNADRKQRDTWIAGLTWQDWENGKREQVDKLMARRS